MKNNMWKFCWMAVLLCATVFSRTPAAIAQDNEPGTGERLQRLERRLNELAERDQQILQRLNAMDGHQGGRPMAQMNAPQQPPMPAMPPHPEMQRRLWAQAPAAAPAMNPEAAKARHDIHGFLCLLFLIGFICNILLAIWIYTDIRKRNEGSGIFIALALVAGIPTAIIYSLVRIGDKKA